MLVLKVEHGHDADNPYVRAFSDLIPHMRAPNGSVLLGGGGSFNQLVKTVSDKLPPMVLQDKYPRRSAAYALINPTDRFAIFNHKDSLGQEDQLYLSWGRVALRATDDADLFKLLLESTNEGLAIDHLRGYYVARTRTTNKLATFAIEAALTDGIRGHALRMVEDEEEKNVLGLLVLAEERLSSGQLPPPPIGSL